MKVKKLFGALLAICLSIAFAHAQEKAVTGTVTDQDGRNLLKVGVAVQVRCTGEYHGSTRSSQLLAQSVHDGVFATGADDRDDFPVLNAQKLVERVAC